MKKSALGSEVLFLLFALSGQAVAGNGGEVTDSEPPVVDEVQVDRFWVSKNAATGQTQFTVGNGAESATVIYDGSSDRIYVSNPHGVVDVSLAQATLEYAGGNQQVANAVAHEIRTGNSWGGSFEQFFAPNIEWRPPGSAPGGCDLSPCGPGQYRPDVRQGDWARYWGVRGYDPGDDRWYEYIYTPDDVARDRNYYDTWRTGKCEQAREEDWQAGYALATAAGSCPFFKTPPGAIGCGVSIVQLMRSANSDTHKKCFSNYPGPGRWGR